MRRMSRRSPTMWSWCRTGGSLSRERSRTWPRGRRRPTWRGSSVADPPQRSRRERMASVNKIADEDADDDSDALRWAGDEVGGREGARLPGKKVQDAVAASPVDV